MDSWSYSKLEYTAKSKTLTGDVIRHEYVVRRSMVNNEKENILFANYYPDPPHLNELFIGLRIDDTRFFTMV